MDTIFIKCEICNGEGKVDCPDCHNEEDKKVKCSQCGGSGKVICLGCCGGGYVDMPALA